MVKNHQLPVTMLPKPPQTASHYLSSLGGEIYPYGLMKHPDQLFKQLADNAFNVIVGKSGYGKTSHALYLLNKAPRVFYLYARNSMQVCHLAKAISVRLVHDIPALNIDNHERIQFIKNHFSKQSTHVFIDDAHLLPLESIAFCHELASAIPKLTITLFGLPSVLEKTQALAIPSSAVKLIGGLQDHELQAWLVDCFNKTGHAAIVEVLPESFYQQLWQQSEGIPRQVTRLAGSMLASTLAKRSPPKQHNRRIRSLVLGAFACFSLIAVAYHVPNHLPSKQTKKVITQAAPRAKRSVNIVNLIETRIARDEQLVLSSKRGYEQIAATQKLSDVIRWLGELETTEDLRVVRAMRQSRPFYLILRNHGSKTKLADQTPWMRSHASLAHDINAFLSLEYRERLQA